MRSRSKSRNCEPSAHPVASCRDPLVDPVRQRPDARNPEQARHPAPPGKSPQNRNGGVYPHEHPAIRKYQVDGTVQRVGLDERYPRQAVLFRRGHQDDRMVRVHASQPVGPAPAVPALAIVQQHRLVQQGVPCWARHAGPAALRTASDSAARTSLMSCSDRLPLGLRVLLVRSTTNRSCPGSTHSDVPVQPV